jgi:Tol biopolymer transport system component
VIFDRYQPQITGRDLWLYDFERGTTLRFTSDPADDANGVWSPDGQKIVFSSNRNNGRIRGIYQKDATGTGQDQLLIQTDFRAAFPRQWSTDGRFIMYSGFAEKPDVWALPLFGERKPFRPLQGADFSNTPGWISPDGRWIAYVSNESGERQVYVQPFGAGAGKWRISKDGGDNPVWSRDGKELFYIDATGEMMSVQTTGETQFQAGLPKPLFRTSVPEWRIGGWEKYGVSADGQRFLINIPSRDTFSPITVVLNWQSGLSAREKR